MKKNLIVTLTLSFALGAQVFAADTYTEGLLNSFQQKVNQTAAPVVNTEKQLKEKQRALQELPQNQVYAKRQQIDAQQQAQLELINKKRQQVQTQKDLFNQQKNELKNIFSVQ